MIMLVFVLAVVGLVLLWIRAYKVAWRGGGAKGKSQFFGALIISGILIGGGYLFIVYTNLNCNGFLCVLEYVFYWFIEIVIVMLLFPILLMIAYNGKTAGINSEARKEVIDDDL